MSSSSPTPPADKNEAINDADLEAIAGGATSTTNNWKKDPRWEKAIDKAKNGKG